MSRARVRRTGTGRILGVDPGHVHTGLCVIDNNGDPLATRTLLLIGSFVDRADTVEQTLSQWLGRYGIERVIVEDAYPQRRKGIDLLLKMVGVIVGALLGVAHAQGRSLEIRLAAPGAKGKKRTPHATWDQHSEDAYQLARLGLLP